MNKQELLNIRKESIDYQSCINTRLNEISSPLLHLNIEWFGYGKFYLDEKQQCDKFLWINTHLDSFCWYCLNALDNGPDFTEAIRQTKVGEINYFPVTLNSNDYIIKAFKELFQLSAGISVYKRSLDYVELWDFSTTQPNSLITSCINMNQIKILSSYIDYFNEKLYDLDLKEKYAIQFPLKLDFSYYTTTSVNVDEFIKNTKSNKKSITVRGKSIFFSKREWECLYMITGGQTIKEVAQLLKLSPKTVEKYLNNLKYKTGYNKKSDLIKMYLNETNSFARPMT